MVKCKSTKIAESKQSDNLYFMAPLFIKAPQMPFETKHMCVASKLNYALDECGFQLAESRLTPSALGTYP